MGGQAAMTEHNKQGCGGIRRRSAKTLFGLPLFDVAVGPDLERGELRGHACGIIAYGDTAKGWLAMGGIAFGGIAFGGISIGILSFGGLSFGLIALGGLAAGGIACGGCAAGFVAAGGQAVGKYAVSALGSSPEAVEFFSRWLPFLPVNR
ncbi:MAG: hypothetical protein ACTFAL_02650 [Candidatus Electronema sp. V4]|uniref:hypothetical protein n=1 Tax=Candidatus Electronema sp. V4 TaxID=3454756 RepID=UPI0040557B56